MRTVTYFIEKKLGYVIIRATSESTENTGSQQTQCVAVCNDAVDAHNLVNVLAHNEPQNACRPDKVETPEGVIWEGGKFTNSPQPEEPT